MYQPMIFWGEVSFAQPEQLKITTLEHLPICSSTCCKLKNITYITLIPVLRTNVDEFLELVFDAVQN